MFSTFFLFLGRNTKCVCVSVKMRSDLRRIDLLINFGAFGLWARFPHCESKMRAERRRSMKAEGRVLWAPMMRSIDGLLFHYSLCDNHNNTPFHLCNAANFSVGWVQRAQDGTSLGPLAAFDTTQLLTLSKLVNGNAQEGWRRIILAHFIGNGLDSWSPPPLSYSNPLAMATMESPLWGSICFFQEAIDWILALETKEEEKIGFWLIA